MRGLFHFVDRAWCMRGGGGDGFWVRVLHDCLVKLDIFLLADCGSDDRYREKVNVWLNLRS